MGVISNLNRLDIRDNNKFFYKGEEIGKWWGKTLYRFDKDKNELHFQTFSIFERFLQLFCYKKEFNSNNLQEYLQKNGVDLQKLTGAKGNNKKLKDIGFEALSVLSKKKEEFIKLNSDNSIPDESIIQLFEDGLPVNAIINTGDSSLYECSVFYNICLKGRYNVASYLINKGAEINLSLKSGYGAVGYVSNQPLHAAVSSENKELIQLLLDKGADVNAVNLNGETSIIKAALLNSQDIVELLLKKGANVNPDKINLSNTPLFVAIKNDNIAMVESLLKHGAQMTKRTGGLMGTTVTALSIAARAGNLEMVKLLVEKGANINELFGYGKNSALRIAILNDSLEMVKLLLNLGAAVGPEDINIADNLLAVKKRSQLEIQKLLKGKVQAA